VSRRRSCTAKIQLSFGRRPIGIGKTEISAYNSKPKYFAQNSNATSMSDDKHVSSSYRLAQCVSLALRPPRTIPLLPANSAGLDTGVKVTSDDKSNVFIEIESNDISSLRAIINSYLGLADASYKCITQGDENQTSY
jgi:hypothetical protein